VHKDPSKRDLIERYEREFPPAAHRAGQLVGVMQERQASLQPCVTDEDLVRAAQNDDHLAVMRGLGCTSCMMVPILAHGEPLGVISLMIADGARAYGTDDLAVAQELAHRAALAIDNARLYRATRAREESTNFLAAASAILGSSLEYETTLRSLANVVVPRFADWCAIDVVGTDGVVEQLAVAHVDPSKVELAREYNRRWPPNPHAASGARNVIRTGKSELYADIPDEMLVAATRDAEHLRVARELGLKSALIVPLSARGRTLGALSLIWAESARRYAASDVVLMEELGRRAGVAVDNATLYDEAQRAVRLRDDFISIASHELKTPLTSLQLQVGSIQRVIERDGMPPPDKLASKIALVDRQVDRLGMLVNALLDVSRATAGRLQLTRETVDVAQLCRDVVARLQPDLTSARCPVTLQLDDGLVGQLDRLRVDQIVTNFVGNAIKYGVGKPIEVAAKRNGDDVTITVTDHGIGLAEDDHTRIFERFARAVSPEQFAGLGLGLWIVRVYVDAMGGSVRVQSRLGEGATFSATIPLCAKA
jgi:signal transduction histidine kinase